MIQGDPNRHMLPLVQSTTWRSEVVIAKVILTARAQRLRATKPTKVQEQHPSSRRAITGPQGAKSESLSMGLGL